MPKYDFNKVACNFNEIALQHRCSHVNLLHIFTSFPRNTSGRLLLKISFAIKTVTCLIFYNPTLCIYCTWNSVMALTEWNWGEMSTV